MVMGTTLHNDLLFLIHLEVTPYEKTNWLHDVTEQNQFSSLSNAILTDSAQHGIRVVPDTNTNHTTKKNPKNNYNRLGTQDKMEVLKQCTYVGNVIEPTWHLCVAAEICIHFDMYVTDKEFNMINNGCSTLYCIWWHF